jgi:hypothetical protein
MAAPIAQLEHTITGWQGGISNYGYRTKSESRRIKKSRHNTPPRLSSTAHNYAIYSVSSGMQKLKDRREYLLLRNEHDGSQSQRHKNGRPWKVESQKECH